MTKLLDKTLIHELMETLLTKAKLNRESFKYSGDEKFAQVAVMLKPNYEPVIVPLAFKNAYEKNRQMWALSATARIVRAPAVLMVSDARWARSDKLIPAMGLPKIDGEDSLKKFQEEYQRVLREKYDGQIKNLPRECWSEALVVVAKGPELDPLTVFAPYEEGPDDSIRWLDPTPHEDWTKMQWPMLPDWWVQ